MKYFAKNGFWIAAILTTVMSAFAQNPRCTPAQRSFEQGQEMRMSQLVAGYNAPARIDVRGSWDIYANGAFTFWQPMQENMELGIVSSQANPVYAINGKIVNPKFHYKPGFQVGLGAHFDHDFWDTALKYTWFRGRGKTSTRLNSETAPSTVLYPISLNPADNIGGFYDGKQKWTLHIDILDGELARCYYVGTKLSFRPFFAARALWIRQSIRAEYSNQAPIGGVDPENNLNIHKRSQSWAVGPRTGLYSNWMIGEGFRLYGNGAGDILFTQYTKLKSNQQLTTFEGTPVVGSSFLVDQSKLNCLRGHLDLELGFGWGTYFDNNNWHIDFAAGYGFQIFFDQNMFRRFSDDVNLGVSNSPNGNLYVHGLTASGRFDF